MKKILLALFAAASVSVQAASPVGQIIFVTSNGGASNPVFDVGGGLAGSSIFGQLYVGLDANNLQKVGSALNFATGGANPGFIAASSTVTWNQTVSTTTMPVGDQAGVYVFRAWSGASNFETAATTVGAKIGSSATTSITAFGGVNAGGNPSSNFAFANLHNSFTLSTVAVPEPATIALGLFGAAGLIFRRRK